MRLSLSLEFARARMVLLLSEEESLFFLVIANFPSEIFMSLKTPQIKPTANHYFIFFMAFFHDYFYSGFQTLQRINLSTMTLHVNTPKVNRIE